MRIRYFIAIWGFLLIVSTGYRWYRGFEPQAAPNQKVMRVEVAVSVAQGGFVQLAYRDLNAGVTDTAPLLLLHGNPVAGSAMLPLANALGGHRRILIPDLPGLGASSKNVTAFSSEVQVSVLVNWLRELGLTEVHVAGYSQGSAVALEIADREPELVRSVSLIAGVGLQEHELLGRYEWNQPLYAAYHATLWSLRWLSPHFGFFDAAAVAPTTARNFADTDLRRNRAFLVGLEHPALILHSVDDRFVSFAAAVAHAELLPQARFYALGGGHMGIFSRTQVYADLLRVFLVDVDSGLAIHRTQADKQGRADQPAAGMVLPTSPPMAQSWLIALLLFVIVFLSEDLACIIGGILAVSSVVSLSAAIFGCCLGIFVSDVGLYLIGRFMGDRAMRVGFIAKASEGRSFARLKSGYERKGLQVVFLTRFIPGSRVPTYITAGTIKLPFMRFCIWLGLAAAVWTPVLVSLAYIFGRPLIGWWEQFGVVVLPFVALGIVLLYLGIQILTQTTTYRGRRALRGKWIRFTQWEFWPALPVYLPVFLYCAGLAIRHRSVTVWAACNPGMYPASGLVLESKSDILSQLNSQIQCVADWARIEPADTVEARMTTLGNFMKVHSLNYPVVLKPDIGQRGEGVAVIKSKVQAEVYLRENGEPVIAQRFIPGAEFGVFMVRMPGEEFEIFSITEKVLPTLVGDGKRSLERLILDDERAVALAKHYMKVNIARLQEVPVEGASIPLVELGTHCRGAVFLDGNSHKSDALLARLSNVLASYDGFNFGRFDLRVGSTEQLMAGEGLQILELNGVSSESTDIYDPKNSIFHAWSVLCRQWRLAFEIGAANREKGASVPTLGEILAVLRGHRARSPYEVKG